MPANERQVAGNHYRRFAIQAWDIINMFGLGYFDGNAVKYLLRWRHKGGVEDLEKAMHFIEKLIEIEKEKAAFTLPEAWNIPSAESEPEFKTVTLDTGPEDWSGQRPMNPDDR